MKEYIISADDVKALEEEFSIKLSFDKGDELIRCKDCARNPKNGKARTICPCPMDRYMGDDGYCKKAEPKEAD